MAAKPREQWSPGYRKRIEAAEKKGLTKSQARGHAKKGEKAASEVTGTKLRGAAKRQHEAKEKAKVSAVRWSAPTPRGTRDVDTANVERVGRAIAEAAGREKDLIIGVKADSIQMPKYERSRKAAETGWVFSGQLSAKYVASVIEDEDGNVEAAIRALFAEQGVEFGKIERYLVKELGA